MTVYVCHLIDPSPVASIWSYLKWWIIAVETRFIHTILPSYTHYYILCFIVFMGMMCLGFRSWIQTRSFSYGKTTEWYDIKSFSEGFTVVVVIVFPWTVARVLRISYACTVHIYAWERESHWNVVIGRRIRKSQINQNIPFPYSISWCFLLHFFCFFLAIPSLYRCTYASAKWMT